MTPRAREALEAAETISCYTGYLPLLGDLARGKRVLSTGMRRERERVEAAVAEAVAGRRVCLVSSGDPGVYGMAGLCLQLLPADAVAEGIAVEVVPGVSSITACAALLGAPLSHDFAVISLSDLLTDSALIERRVAAAAAADFVLVLTNPRSRRRTEPIERARSILARFRDPETPVGIVRSGFREGQEVTLTDLEHMLDAAAIDMRTTVIVGSSRSFRRGRFMITPRGYDLDDTAADGGSEG